MPARTWCSNWREARSCARRSRTAPRPTSSLRQILAKVSLGEGDAGFVYRTDAIAGGNRIRVIEIPAKLNVVAEYPIAVVEHSVHPDLARAWIDLLLSERGQSILSRAGFRPR